MSFVPDAKLVKELRQKTGAGIMNCKKALIETEGDVEKAVDWLRKKGIASASKKAGRETKEGLIDSYIHTGNRIGVLVEINCETDFVARNEVFKSFVHNIAMHITAASPLAVDEGDIPSEVLEREKKVYMEQAIESGKPENIIEKMVEGKLRKFKEENCLLKQPYVKDTSQTVEEYLKETITKIGENIQIRRFTRFQLGD